MDINIISSNNHASTLHAYDKHLAVVGVLAHGTKIEPQTVEDADALIQWLEDWKTKKGLPSNHEKAQGVWEAMDDTESMALRRCASYQMNQEDWDEIGSSDISGRAISFIQGGAWPTDLKEVGAGFLTDEYQKDVQRDPITTPFCTLNRILEEGSHKRALPAIAYEGKHGFSPEAVKFYDGAQKMFNG